MRLFSQTKLVVKWLRGHGLGGDFFISHPPGTPKSDAHLVHNYLFEGVTGHWMALLLAELERRGYDPTTFRLEIARRSDQVAEVNDMMPADHVGGVSKKVEE